MKSFMNKHRVLSQLQTVSVPKHAQTKVEWDESSICLRCVGLTLVLQGIYPGNTFHFFQIGETQMKGAHSGWSTLDLPTDLDPELSAGSGEAATVDGWAAVGVVPWLAPLGCLMFRAKLPFICLRILFNSSPLGVRCWNGFFLGT